MSALNIYFTFNFLILIAAVLAYIVFSINRRYRIMSSKDELRISYAMFTTAVILAAGVQFAPRATVFEPAVKVWSEAKLRLDDSMTVTQGRIHVGQRTVATAVPLAHAHGFSLALLSLFAMFGALAVLADLRRLDRLERGAFLVRAAGRVRIFASDATAAPFSYWRPGLAAIILPSAWFDNAADTRLAIFHEIQHHRDRDTISVYPMRFLKFFLFWNPGLHLWISLISEIQEFACDEAVLGRRRVSSKAYAGCLIRAAQFALSHKRVPACAAGMARGTHGHSLTRRIESMFKKDKKVPGRKWILSLFVLIFGLMTAGAVASQSIVQDRRVSIEAARAMAARLDPASAFPVQVNEAVLKQLNRYIGTPEGREFMKQALARMENYRPMIEKKLDEYGVPRELLAIPITESGYKNLEPKKRQSGAGLWMFIVSTARIYGMRVDDKNDDRLNVDIETDAAMRYLKSTHTIFNDWHLAVLSYNIGESRVFRGVQKTGTRDIWKLLDAGFENDKDYIPKLMAAILIMKNPESLE